MMGELDPVDGMVKRHNHLRIAQYHQHLAEKLNPDQTPLEYMVIPFPKYFAELSPRCKNSKAIQ